MDHDGMHRFTLPFLIATGCGSVAPTPPASQSVTLHGGQKPASGPTSQPGGHAGHHSGGHEHSGAHGHHPGAHKPSAAQTAGADAPKAHGNHRFTDAKTWSKRFDAPERDAWQKPDAVINRLGLTPEMRVADIGAGTGYFTVRFARALPKGHVIGADLEPAMVDFMVARAAKAGLTNMTAIAVPPTAPRLPEPVDLIFVCNTWHHVHDRGAWLAGAASQIKPGGRLAIVDYKPGVDSPGPPQQMRLAADQVIADMQAAGFTLAERDDALLPRQYMLIFNAPPAPGTAK